MKIVADKEILQILSDLFTNLSAGWFALIFIGKTFAYIPSTEEFVLFLTVNIFGGTVSLVLAIMLKKMIKEYE